MNDNDSHLNILRIFHYIYGSFCLIGSLFTAIYIVLGAVFLVNPAGLNQGTGGPPPEFMGGLFLGIGVVATVVIVAYGVVNILVGRNLTRRSGWLFSVIVSGLNCINMPLGTALGVFTIVVLIRPEVKQQFGA